MKKCNFVLMEVFLAIALLAIFAIPLIRSPLTAYYRERENLVEMELQRHAELIFYDTLKGIKYTWEDFPRENSAKLSNEKEITISLGEMGEVKRLSHCHIFNAHKKNHTHDKRKLHFHICFPPKKEECSQQSERYKFVFFAERVAK